MIDIKLFRNIFLAMIIFANLEIQAEDNNEHTIEKQVLIEAILMDFGSVFPKTAEKYYFNIDAVNRSGSLVGIVNGSKDSIDFAWGFFDLLSFHQATSLFAKPTLLASNNELMKYTCRNIYDVPVSVDGTVSPVITYEKQEANLDLTILPSINHDDTITLQVDLACDVAHSMGMYGKKNEHTIGSVVTIKSGELLIFSKLLAHTPIQDSRKDKRILVVLRASIVRSDFQH